jgi:hypothetical protein
VVLINVKEVDSKTIPPYVESDKQKITDKHGKEYQIRAMIIFSILQI